MSKQSFNGIHGEDRTRAILSKRFFVLERSVDVEGADFLVQTYHDTIEQLRQAKEKISIFGIVQSKYFEDSNEVLIHRHYVEDKDGVISEFFAMLHTDVLDDEHTYFFNAQEIIDSWTITKRKSGKTTNEYYRFKITQKRKYTRYLDLPKSEILQKIEDGIIKSEQYRNNSYINKILKNERKPISIYNKGLSPELLKKIKNKHIVDKMYYSLKELDTFRRIFPYRIANNLSFEDKHNSSTYYHQFKLRTSNTEILKLFKSIEISDSVKITNLNFFKNVQNVEGKLNFIVKKLYNNSIHTILHDNEEIPINLVTKDKCDCSICHYNRLAFFKTYDIANKEIQSETTKDLWDSLQIAHSYVKLFQYSKALEILELTKTKALKLKEDVIYFITLFNIHSIKWKSFESKLPNLQNEINKLSVSAEEFNLLESVYKYSVFDTYQNSIDKEYRQIIKYKNGRYPNNTTNPIRALYNHFNEYLNFTEGNYIAINSICDFKTMVKKVMESLIISFSMNTKFSYHLISFNDHMIQYAVHYCDPNELLSYFQNNSVKSIPYRSEDNYINNALSNFFSKENVIFLKNETNYFDNRTKNPDLRRRSTSIFENLCILSGHLKFTIEDGNLLNKIEYFLREIDVSDHTASMLFYLINKDDFKFPDNDIVQLIQLMIEDERFKNSYLLTNLIRAFINRNMDSRIIGEKLKDNIIAKSIKYPTNNIFEVLPGILGEQYKRKLIDDINVKIAEF